jgi:hypothetical protein
MSLVSWRKVEKLAVAQAVLVGVAAAEVGEMLFAIAEVVEGDLEEKLEGKY